MPTPILISELSTTAASNFPAGGDSPANLDDVQRAHAAFIAKLRDESATIATVQTLTNKTLTTPVLSNPSYSGATANGGTVTTIDINGGTVDGTVIGGASAAAGSFTTVSATGASTLGAGPLPILNIGNQSGNLNTLLNFVGSNVQTNWQLKTAHTSNGLSIIPSTAVGGSTFTTSVADFSLTGLTVTGLNATGVVAFGANTQIINGSKLYLADAGNTSFPYLDAATVGVITVRSPAGASIGAFSSTGLAVTGALSASTGLTTSGGSLGYVAGAGGTVTQATSKTTGVTLNKPCGTITMHAETLTGGASAVFTFSNNFCNVTDAVIVNALDDFGGIYTAQILSVWYGYFVVRVTNITGGALAQAVRINFSIIKGAAS